MASRPDRPSGPPTPEDRAETRKAIRLIALCAAVVALVYAAVAGSMTDDAYLTRLGRKKEIHFIQRDIRELDRQAQHGDAPITWILGSSITREAFDAERIERALSQAGSAHHVLKYAFNRGAPLFSHLLLEDLPVRPGDRVVTSIAEDNFRADWLANSGDFTLYVQSMLTPAEIMGLQEESLATRIEWSLSAFPPSYYARNRDAFRRGIIRTLDGTLGLREPRIPAEHARSQPFSNTDRSLASPSKKLWTFEPEELRLEPGQPNFDGLQRLQDAVAERGAHLIVVYVPARPALYEDVLDPSIIQRFHDHFDATLPEFHRLRPRRAAAYQDMKHANNRGRPGFSDELADLLIRDEGLTPPPREQPLFLAPVTPATERIWQGAGR